MNAIELLLNRNSRGMLAEPAPANKEREQIFQAALRAPDHGQLRPWRFLVAEGTQLDCLGEVLEQACVVNDPDTSEAQRLKARKGPLRAPMVVVAICKKTDNPKVPAWEQVVSAGCAVHQMLLAAEALGFAGMWRTGPLTNHPVVHNRLQLSENEEIVGFLYLGTPSSSPKQLEPLAVDDFFQPLNL